MNANGNEENSDEAKEDDGVNQNGSATGVHASELNYCSAAWYLKQKAWAQQHEQHHSDHHRAPISHFRREVKGLGGDTSRQVTKNSRVYAPFNVSPSLNAISTAQIRYLNITIL